MKKLTPFLLTSLLLVLCFSSCKEKFETVPFEATFFTDLEGIAPDSINCAAPHSFLNTQAGEGSEVNMGTFTTLMTFCINPDNLEYVNGNGSFVDANGDEIQFIISGQVKPSTNPDYDLEFQDPFTITGGTGRYEGATGSGTTNSFVKHATQRTDHVWSGTVTLKK